MTMPYLGADNLFKETLNPVGVDPIMVHARVQRWLEITASVCKDASRLHGIGFMHLDIKPGNIVNGKLVDFGSAVHHTEAAADKDLKTSSWYKPVSMNLLYDQDHDFSVDVFSIAITLMEKMGWGSSLFSKSVEKSGLLHSLSVDDPRFKQVDAVYEMHWKRAIAEFFGRLSVMLQESGMSVPQIDFVVSNLTHMSMYHAEERLPYTALHSVAEGFKAIAAEYAVSLAGPLTSEASIGGVHSIASTLSHKPLAPQAEECVPSDGEEAPCPG